MRISCTCASSIALASHLLDQFAGLDDDFARGRSDHVVGGRAAQRPLAEGHHHLARIDDGGDLDALVGAAIIFGDDRVLRDVDEAAGQIARVRRLERRVGKTLAGAMGRVEVFENRQPLLEVGDDRRLDDLARRLGHQAAHAGKLLHLGRRTARAGMRHHIDRVDRLFAAGLLVDLDRRNAVHHLLGDAVGAFRPGIDDLVVLLALGDEAVIILLLVVADEILGLGDDLRLRLRDHHVVLAEGNAGTAGMLEAERHDPVAEDDRLLLTAIAIDGVDQLGDGLLRQQLVGQRRS